MTKTLIDRDLDYYDDVAASEVPFALKILKADGTEDGLVLDVLGSQSETVQKAVNALVNERRKRQANAAAVTKSEADFVPIEDDISFGFRLTAARVVGWNLKKDFTPEAAFRLVSRSESIREQITRASNDLANFTQSSPTA